MPVSVCARFIIWRSRREPLCADDKNKNLVPRVGEIGKLLGAKWKEMNDEEKKVQCPRSVCTSREADQRALQPYVDQAAADKIRAEKEKEVFTVSGLLVSLSWSRT